LESGVFDGFGSGGGYNGSGCGGGSLILQAGTNIILKSSAAVSSDGSSPQLPELGAGSGGSIVLIGENIFNAGGRISANGGDGIAAGSGGGGRISIMVSRIRVLLSPVATFFLGDVFMFLIVKMFVDSRPCGTTG
jgi:hypothetical protein